MNKKILWKIIFSGLIVFSFFNSSCSSDDNGDANINNGVLKAKIDGVLFESIPALSFFQKNGPLLVAGGGTASGDTFQVNIYGFTGEGTYVLDSDSDNYAVIVYSSQSQGESWNSAFVEQGQVGELVITHSSEDNLRGTFYGKITNFDGDETKTVTEGEFNLSRASINP